MAFPKARFAGVTTEIMGEGWSMGPLNDDLKQRALREQGDIKYEIVWNTLGEYLRYLEKRGISCNVASFIGATTIRSHVVGFENRAPTPEELERMRELVRLEMEDGALGIGTSLISARLLRENRGADRAVQSGREIQRQIHSHMRSEGNQLSKPRKS